MLRKTGEMVEAPGKFRLGWAREAYNVGPYSCHYPFSLPAPTVLQRGEDLPGVSSLVLNLVTGNPAEASKAQQQCPDSRNVCCI